MCILEYVITFLQAFFLKKNESMSALFYYLMKVTSFVVTKSHST